MFHNGPSVAALIIYYCNTITSSTNLEFSLTGWWSVQTWISAVENDSQQIWISQLLPQSKVILFLADGDDDYLSGVSMTSCKKMKTEQTLNLKYKVEVFHEDWTLIYKNLIFRVFFLMFRVFYNRSNPR